MQIDPSQQQQLLAIAANTIRAALSGQSWTPPSTLDAQLTQPAGCFVSLHDVRSHHLRGCIGNMDATQPLVRAVVYSARAVLEDPRFTNQPVTLAELPDLTLEISALSPLKPAPTPLDFDPLDDGIHLTIDRRHGVFLPQVARQTGWTRHQLLSRLCTEKMGLDPDAWQRPDARLAVFSTLIIGPVPFPPPGQ